MAAEAKEENEPKATVGKQKEETPVGKAVRVMPLQGEPLGGPADLSVFVREGTDDDAAATFTLADEALLSLANEDTSPRELFLRGALRVDGG